MAVIRSVLDFRSYIDIVYTKKPYFKKCNLIEFDVKKSCCHKNKPIRGWTVDTLYNIICCAGRRRTRDIIVIIRT